MPQVIEADPAESTAATRLFSVEAGADSSERGEIAGRSTVRPASSCADPAEALGATGIFSGEGGYNPTALAEIAARSTAEPGTSCFVSSEPLEAPRTVPQPISANPSDRPERSTARGSTNVPEISFEPPPAPLPNFPGIGDRLLHFEIVELLGSGGFARVYLARQESLANRLVALKVGRVASDEPQKLARLRHTNIVPVYSVHATNFFHIICMPYLGRRTLADVANRLADPATQRVTGSDLGQLLRPEVVGSDPGQMAAAADSPYAGRTFAEAVLMLGEKLAEGLEHAHEQGILHRDLKPANILLTDDGVPMILDFNVSSELDSIGERDRIGGTVQYMSPEQIRSFRQPNWQKKEKVDARSDLYSLGLVLYELLLGRNQFSVPKNPRHIDWDTLLAERMELLSPPSRFNPTATPATDAIFAKLLAPNPADRYPSAAAFLEDCGRQLNHRPLRFAANTSIRERAAKWRRRNPRLATALLVGGGTTAFLILPVMGIAYREEQLMDRARQVHLAEAEVLATDAIGQLQKASLLLSSQNEPGATSRGLDLVKDLVARYGLEEGKPLEADSSFAVLGDGRREELREKLGEALILTARAEAQDGGFSPEAIRRSLRWNAFAGEQFPPESAPDVLNRQRGEMQRRLEGLPPAVEKVPPVRRADETNDYFDGLDLAVGGHYREAVPLLQRISEKQPKRFRVWFSLGMCHDALGHSAEAVSAFSVCIGLQPESDLAWANRGLSLLKLKRYREAEADLTLALERRPNWLHALLNRGLARLGQEKFAEAEADFGAALACEGVPSRVYFLRSRVRKLLGNPKGAEEDRQAFLRSTPNDLASWIARGKLWMDLCEFGKAMADYESALRIQPDSTDALLNKAILLADHLNRPADCIPLMDRLLEIQPQNLEVRGSRGVYLARLGRSAEARRDAEEVLKADRSNYRIYQMAGLYAQLAKLPNSEGDRQKALELMGRALRAGFRDWATVKEDGDLDPVRQDTLFERLLSAAKFLDAPGQANSGKDAIAGAP